MVCKINAVERLQLIERKLRRLREAALFVGVLPDKENLVSRVERIHLELVIRVTSRDKHLYVVVVVNRIVAVGVLRVDERFFHAESNVEILLVPNNGGARVVDRAAARQDIDEPRREWRPFPGGLIEPSVDSDRLVNVIGGIPRDFVLRTWKR